MQRRLLIYLFLTIFLIFILDYFGLLSQAVFVSDIRVMDENKGLFVDNEHKICKVDNDCVFIDYRCDNCGCGEPVNKKYQRAYSNKLKEVCTRFNSLSCEDSICLSGEVKCVKNMCVFISVY